MSEDMVVIQKGSSLEHEGRDTISSLPHTFLEALSAIQEQNFVEAELEDPSFYGQLFTFKHKLTFLKVGLLTGIADSLLTVLGMIFYCLGIKGILPIFSVYQSNSLFNKILAYIITILPYIITIYLVFSVFKRISGTISKKMALFLSLGFVEGSILTTLLMFIVGYGLSTDFASFIYQTLDAWQTIYPILNGIADFFWNHFRYAIVDATWKELWTVIVISIAIFSCLWSRNFWLKRNQKFQQN